MVKAFCPNAIVNKRGTDKKKEGKKTLLGNVRENRPLGLIWSLRNATKIFLLDPQIDSPFR